MDYCYKNFGIMFLSTDFNKTIKNKIASKIRKFDSKIEKYKSKQEEIFYKELKVLGFENNMGVIQKIN
jgi:hypothetical protein